MADPRDRLATALENYLDPDQMKVLVDEVLAMRKRVSVPFKCKKCGAQQLQYGEISDVKAVALALPDLLNQAYGRPSEQELQETVIFQRLTKLDDDEEAA